MHRKTDLRLPTLQSKRRRARCFEQKDPVPPENRVKSMTLASFTLRRVKAGKTYLTNVLANRRAYFQIVGLAKTYKTGAVSAKDKAKCPETTTRLPTACTSSVRKCAFINFSNVNLISY